MNELCTQESSNSLLLLTYYNNNCLDVSRVLSVIAVQKVRQVIPVPKAYVVEEDNLVLMESLDKRYLRCTPF